MSPSLMIFHTIVEALMAGAFAISIFFNVWQAKIRRAIKRANVTFMQDFQKTILDANNDLSRRNDELTKQVHQLQINLHMVCNTPRPSIEEKPKAVKSREIASEIAGRVLVNSLTALSNQFVAMKPSDPFALAHDPEGVKEIIQNGYIREVHNVIASVVQIRCALTSVFNMTDLADEL